MNIPPKYEDVVAQLEAERVRADVASADCNDAERREAALREELSKQVERANDFASKLTGAQQRLTVAEQRAEELERVIDSGAARDVLGERRRQIMEEHRLPSDDDDYTLGQLAWAASGYAAGATASHQAGGALQPTNWPWSPRWWKPGTPRQMLIKSGALILAEIERIDRAALKPAEEATGSTCNQIREESGLPTKNPCVACNNGACIDR